MMTIWPFDDYKLIRSLLNDRSPPSAYDQADDKQNEEHKEQYLRDLARSACYNTKTEHSRDE